MQNDSTWTEEVMSLSAGQELHYFHETWKGVA